MRSESRACKERNRSYTAALIAGEDAIFTANNTRFGCALNLGQIYRERRRLYYETVFIVNPDVSKENTETLTDALVKRVEKASGRIVKREYWGSRPLAYQIAKRKRGHYALLVTDGETTAIQALEEGLRLEERVLRFLTTRLQELSDEPSPLLRRQMKSDEATRNANEAAKDKSIEEKKEVSATTETESKEKAAEDTSKSAMPVVEKETPEQSKSTEAGGNAAT